MYAEVLAGPIKVFRAAVGTAEPLPASDTPPSPWELIGQSGTGDEELYSKDGLNVSMTDDREEIEVMNQLYPIEEFRTSARKQFTIKLKDMKLETLGLLLGNSVVQTAPVTGVKGYRRLSNEMSFRTPKHAILIVGYTPYDALEGEYGLNYWAPRVTFKGPGSFDHMLSTPIDVELMINCLMHPTLGLGYTTANYAPAP